jgi:hypothetical protein
MKSVMKGCAVLLVLLVVFVAVMLFYGSREFKPLVTEILHKSSAGQIDAVYAEASQGFQKAITLADFRSFMNSRLCALGAFVEAGTVTGTERRADLSESTAEVSLPLRFEKGEVPGRFRFVSEAERWKLHAVEIDLPADLARPDRTALERISRELLDLYSAGRDEELYARFAPELQQVYPRERFLQDLAGLRQLRGAITGATLSQTRDEADGHVSQDFALQFGEATGEASFKYFWRECRWDVLALNLGSAAQP